MADPLSQFEELPCHVMQNVLSNLWTTDLTKCRLVSKSVKSVADSMTFTIPKIEIDKKILYVNENEKEHETIELALKQFQSILDIFRLVEIGSLSIDGGYSNEFYDIFDVEVSPGIKANSLQLQTRNSDRLIRTLRKIHIPSLKYLRLKTCSMPILDMSEIVGMGVFDSLKVFESNGIIVKGLTAEHTKNLESCKIMMLELNVAQFRQVIEEFRAVKRPKVTVKCDVALLEDYKDFLRFKGFTELPTEFRKKSQNGSYEVKVTWKEWVVFIDCL